MKKTITLAVCAAAMFSTSLFSCKKDDNMAPAGTGAAASTNWSTCDPKTNTRVNLDNGHPEQCPTGQQ